MSDIALLNPLWGAVLDQIRLDVVNRSVQIYAHAVTEVEIPYCVTCIGVRAAELCDATSRIEAWEYVEITEAHLVREATGQLRMRMEFWVPECELVVVGENVTLTEGGTEAHA